MATNEGSLASTSRILHVGHDDDTACTSSAISTPQPGSGCGGVDPPRWLTLRKHPLAVVHGGSPHAARKAFRFASTFGLSKASTMATVWPDCTEVSS